MSPFDWKCLQIGTERAKDLRKNVLIFLRGRFTPAPWALLVIRVVLLQWLWTVNPFFPQVYVYEYWVWPCFDEKLGSGPIRVSCSPNFDFWIRLKLKHCMYSRNHFIPTSISNKRCWSGSCSGWLGDQPLLGVILDW